MRSFARSTRVCRAAGGALLAACLLAAPAPLAAASAKQMYTSALARERALRDADRRPTLKQLRALAAEYERIVFRFPRSGYSDNALWQAAGAYALAYERFNQDRDRRQAERMLARLKAEYPSSSLNTRADEIARLLADRPAPRPAPPARVDAAPAAAAAASPKAATLLAIRRSEVGHVVRLTLELDAEVSYHEERIANPARVFFDLKHTALAQGLGETPLNFADAPVLKQVRIGRREDSTTRVAVDLHGIRQYSVFTLYHPYRLVIDFERTVSPTAIASAPVRTDPVPASSLSSAAGVGEAREAEPAPLPPPAATTGREPSKAPEKAASAEASPLPSKPAKATMAVAPGAPAANGTGTYSLARQLGLGVARIVIDPGHGGHDPGASAHRVTEAELVLDIALRLEKLLLQQRGVEVVMTRRTDVFVPLEERTSIANRAGADLFLSIHANASRNEAARGVETYYLNFASNPEAEEVAARENSASGRTLNALPEIIRAIALNDKLDESRDFAELVQKSMGKRLRPHNARFKSLGVKRAPFVVLIGAGMPSVLAEVSFLTNRQEAALLRTGAYRQRIAEALFDAIAQYQRSLKRVTAVADSSR